MAELSRTQALLHKLRPRAERRAGLWITSREAFWIALETLRSHKLRSFLTLLGVVIATTTLIVVMSVINGMNLFIADRIANLGANVFIVHQYKWAQGYEAWLKARRRNQPIRIEDFEFLRDNLKGYKNIGAEAWMNSSDNQARYKGRTVYEVRISGETPNMIDIGQTRVDAGRYLNDTDYNHESMVCFVGQDLVNDFFPSVEAIEKEIQINGIPFRIIGTAKKLGSMFGESQDNFVQVPLSTYQKVFRNRPSLAVSVQAANSLQMSVLEDEVRALLRARRHTPYNEDDTFGINASETIMDSWHRLTASIFAVTIGVVAVFMVVGGIVIMNIMLASVTERTHEIGIRKSLGARRRDILMQFLIEAAVMAGSGGAIGILLAPMISKLVDVFFTSSVPLSAVLVGLFLSTAVGLFFGIYPANKAANLEPIEALRMEA
ncbi:MAG TPA: ABC transporter permease [Candidatus Sulfotelmatobacter sp.]|nr:ABC transporter permease [Candidatus Sulfotelmatobacter sp.]